MYFFGVLPTEMYNLVGLRQISCLICLSDKSGNFLIFGAKIARNTVKSEKTGFGMVNETAPEPVFCVFRAKMLRSFYFELSEVSRREKSAEGGFKVNLTSRKTYGHDADVFYRHSRKA